MFHGAFNGKMIIYDPYLSDSMADKRADTIPPTHLHRASTLGEMPEISDVVSLHVLLLPSTKNLISCDQLRIMKRNIILVNPVRGGIINEDDLFRALEEGLSMGAGLDAFVTEPPILSAYPRLVSHPRVISTLVTVLPRYFALTTQPSYRSRIAGCDQDPGHLDDRTSG
jgi:phosphoglycerate dehydrogenase-like enzyme